MKGFLHALGIKLSIYIDDGRVAAASPEETTAKTSLTLLVLQLAGLNIQWKKRNLLPSQKLLHLGFFTDTCAMLYSVPEEKIVLLKSLISVICKLYMDNMYVSAKLLATVLGKIMSMLRSHGDILRIMSRSSQHVLGVQTLQFGWNVSFPVSVHIFTELSFIRDILESSNGQPIFTAAANVHTIDSKRIAEMVANIVHSECPIENLFVSDASATHAFVYNADGSFRYVKDFEFTAGQACSSSGHRELLAVKLVLESDQEFFQKFAGGKIFWQTDSRNCFTFLRRGSRVPNIQQDVMAIKLIESRLHVKLVPVWTTRDHGRLREADLGSKFSQSTDEWSVDRHQLADIFKFFKFTPSVDGFASSHNRVCDKYFSAIPQSNSSGVNFFAQPLSDTEQYFLCPPVSLVIPCFKKICSVSNLKALLIVPEWTGHVFWPFLFNGCSYALVHTQRSPVQGLILIRQCGNQPCVFS